MTKKKEKTPAAEKKGTAKVNAPKQKHGKRYQKAAKLIKKGSCYPLAKAVALAKKTSISRFVGNLEAHFVTSRVGTLGEAKLPYSSGKTKRVVIADDKVIAAIKAGKLDFDILIASPKMMPKLLPFARTLGPRGLMPNPKNGTLAEEPEKALEKFSQAGLILKTEKKAPILHSVVGKLSQPDKELIANLQSIIDTLHPNNIKKLVLAATMGPGIKVAINPKIK